MLPIPETSKSVGHNLAAITPRVNELGTTVQAKISFLGTIGFWDRSDRYTIALNKRVSRDNVALLRQASTVHRGNPFCAGSRDFSGEKDANLNL